MTRRRILMHKTLAFWLVAALALGLALIAGCVVNNTGY